MPTRQRSNFGRRQTLSSNAQKWPAGDKSCCVFFKGRHPDKLEALWREFGDASAMHWERGMRLPIKREELDA